MQIANRQKEFDNKINIVDSYSVSVGRITQYIALRENQIFPLKDEEKLGNRFDELGYLRIELVNDRNETKIEEIDLKFVYLGTKIARGKYKESFLENAFVFYYFPHYKFVYDYIAKQIKNKDLVDKDVNTFIFYCNEIELFVGLFVCSGNWSLARIIENEDYSGSLINRILYGEDK